MPQDMAPPSSDEETPKMKRDGTPKFKKDKGEKAVPEAPPSSEDAGAPPPQSPDGDDQPRAKKDGKPNKGKGKRDGGAPESCPDGMVPLEDGSCVTPQ